MKLLEFNCLNKEYPRKDDSITVVDNANGVVNSGDFVCVTGHSGSGKSTLLNMIAGLLEPSSGEILFDSKSFGSMNDRELSLLRNSKIGYIPQGHSILWNLTVIDNVRLPFYLSKRSGDPTPRAQSLLERMGIGHLAEVYPHKLSGGELRRVSIARGLINEPEILIADEPTGDLDPDNARHIMELFSEAVKNGMTVLLVTHDPALVHYGSRHLYMETGKLTER
jgi:putative ABC transport system ATP-binding protein